MSVQKYPLANGVDGNPLEVPEHAVAWRVRRGGGRRGRPRVVFDSDTGKQLEVPLTAGIDELVARGCPPGRYRLEAIDRGGQTIPGIVGVTEVFHTEIGDDHDDEPVRHDSLLERQMQLIEEQNLVLFRVIDAMAGAFGTVQPTFCPPAATATTGAETAGPGLGSLLPLLKPEGLSGIAKLLAELGKLGKGSESAEAEGGDA